MAVPPRVVSIGDNCLDVYVEQGCLTIGGSALNVAVRWNRLGFDSAYLGATGQDRAASLVRAGIMAAGLSASGVSTEPGTTGVTLIRLVERNRTFLHEELGVGPGWNPSPRELSDRVAGAAWAHVTGTGEEAHLPQRLVAAGHRVSVDLLGRPNGELGGLAGVEVAFTSADVSREEALVAGQALLRAGVGTAVVMRGANGSLALRGDEVFEMRAEPITPVDTCGAGDSFIAGFVAACLEGAALPERLASGTRSATQACLHLGGFPQEPQPIPPWISERFSLG